MLMKDKTAVLGVTGGIAAYKALELASRLVKTGVDVKVIMTSSAAEFVAPLSFRTLTGNPVAVDMFEDPTSWEVRHISLAKAADVFAIVPATANIIGKMACGIADDMLSTTVMATKAPVLIAPAMNTAMLENPIVQDNIERLSELGYNFVMPAEGRLACGDTGRGKLADVDVIFDAVMRLLNPIKDDLKGKRVTVSAGATDEPIDPVRFITNHSSGKMGCAIAEAASLRGADVTLVLGSHSCAVPTGIDVINVVTAEDMKREVISSAKDSDITVMAAAVADFRPVTVSDEKIKKHGSETLALTLKRNPDILKLLGEDRRDDTVLIGFAMETEDLIENARKKLEEKNADFIVANSLRKKGAGFGGDTNIAVIIGRDGTFRKCPLMSKRELSDIILDHAAAFLGGSPLEPDKKPDKKNHDS